MARAPLLPVAAARQQLIACASVTEVEQVAITACHSRVLAQDLTAKRTQPPFHTSAMDGYAVRAADLAPGRPLTLLGESAAGHRFAGAIGPGETVRIFTGAPLPEGADTILIQENAQRTDSGIVPTQTEPTGRFVRPAGLDFKQGDVLLTAGTVLGARELALAAAMNHAHLPVRRRPRVGILATGDELVLPGENPSPDQIVASNHLAIAAAIAAAGGEPVQLGIARDTLASLYGAIDDAAQRQCDVLVTIGGASVGDHDMVQTALTERGMHLAFWKIAMRPGKPMMFGELGPMKVVGLPGNPVSSIVCSLVFLQPMIAAYLGKSEPGTLAIETGICAVDLPANDEREDYVRSTLKTLPNGMRALEPFKRQDSSMLSVLAASDALLIRAPHEPAIAAGTPVPFLRLNALDA